MLKFEIAPFFFFFVSRKCNIARVYDTNVASKFQRPTLQIERRVTR